MANGPQHLSATDRGAVRSNEALQRAMFALNSERPGEAERIADEVLKRDPRHAGALYILGCALLMQGRAQDAVAPLESAARSRRDPAIDTQLAIALRQVGREEDALSRLKRATKRDLPYAGAYHELGRLLVGMGRYEEAIEALSRGVEIAPMMPQLSIQLGYAFLNCHDAGNAKIAFARALDISPNAPDALFGMAKSHRELGDNTPAAAYFRRHLASAPGDRASWLHLGHCLLELGELEAGYECFRIAARDDPRHYGNALASLAASGRGRFWLKPSQAARFLRATKI
jgi:tetratricopeptide (TPR) repeat protein